MRDVPQYFDPIRLQSRSCKKLPRCSLLSLTFLHPPPAPKQTKTTTTMNA